MGRRIEAGLVIGTVVSRYMIKASNLVDDVYSQEVIVKVYRSVELLRASEFHEQALEVASRHSPFLMPPSQRELATPPIPDTVDCGIIATSTTPSPRTPVLNLGAISTLTGNPIKYASPKAWCPSPQQSPRARSVAHYAAASRASVYSDLMRAQSARPFSPRASAARRFSLSPRFPADCRPQSTGASSTCNTPRSASARTCSSTVLSPFGRNASQSTPSKDSSSPIRILSARAPNVASPAGDALSPRKYIHSNLLPKRPQSHRDTNNSFHQRA